MCVVVIITTFQTFSAISKQIMWKFSQTHYANNAIINSTYNC